MSDDDAELPDDQEQRDRVVFERLATQFGTDLAMRNLEAKRAARAAGLPELRPIAKTPRAGGPRKPDRETEKRVRQRMAEILGQPLAEVDRLMEGEKARAARNTRGGYQRLSGALAPTLQRFGDAGDVVKRCQRCGLEEKGLKLRLNPLDGGQMVCVRFDEKGYLAGCFAELEQIQADRNGREHVETVAVIRAAKERGSLTPDDKAFLGRIPGGHETIKALDERFRRSGEKPSHSTPASKGRANRVKPQQGLPLNQEEPF